MNFEITKCPIGNEDIVVTWIFIVLKRKMWTAAIRSRCFAIVSFGKLVEFGIHIWRLQGVEDRKTGYIDYQSDEM